MKRVYYNDNQYLSIKLSDGNKIDKIIHEVKNNYKRTYNLSVTLHPVLRDLESLFINQRRYKQYL